MNKKPLEKYSGEKLLLRTLTEQRKKIGTENVAHATTGKIRCVADRSRPLQLLQATKTKRLLKSSIILPVRANF